VGLQPLSVALMAEMYECVRPVSAGLSTLDVALALARKPGSRDDETELSRIKVKLLLARDGPEGTKLRPQALSRYLLCTKATYSTLTPSPLTGLVQVLRMSYVQS
jgi:hypothetical protein